MISSEIYIDEKYLEKHFLSIYVFGVCKEADEIIDRYGIDKIVAFVDNNKSGEKIRYHGKRVIDADSLISERGNIPIVIATARFSNNIASQLESLRLVPKKDFFIWDGNYIFRSDNNVDAIVEHFERIWGDYNNKTSDCEIIIPVDNYHVSASIKYAYIANYIAKENNAVIKAFCKVGFRSSELGLSIKRIYQAFNVIDIIDENLDDSLVKEADSIVEQLWENLYSWHDWKKIHIYGIHFGTTMLRDFFRRLIPPDEIRDEIMYSFLKKSVYTIVFWKNYFSSHNVKTVIMSDGTHWEGYIRDIAITNSVPVYSSDEQLKKLTLDYAEKKMYQYFDKMWNQLSSREQDYGIKWATKHVYDRVNGSKKEVALIDKERFVFALEDSGNRVLKKSDKLKVLICPHSFDEDCYWYGEHLFDDNYYSWLCHLGDLSNITLNYEWYLKPHPAATERDKIIIGKILDKYKNISLIPAMISPIQLKREGVRFALTESGTIGHEYPAIGIDVINAGLNPHSRFNFCWNPSTKEEFDELVLNLSDIKPLNNIEELYKFYCLKYLYYNWDYIPYKAFFFENPLLNLSRKGLKSKGYEAGTWIYAEYLKEYSFEKWKKIMDNMKELFEKMDRWKPDEFYKKTIII